MQFVSSDMLDLCRNNMMDCKIFCYYWVEDNHALDTSPALVIQIGNAYKLWNNLTFKVN